MTDRANTQMALCFLHVELAFFCQNILYVMWQQLRAFIIELFVMTHNCNIYITLDEVSAIILSYVCCEEIGFICICKRKKSQCTGCNLGLGTDGPPILKMPPPLPPLVLSVFAVNIVFILSLCVVPFKGCEVSIQLYMLYYMDMKQKETLIWQVRFTACSSDFMHNQKAKPY